jgi:hypothetical protein
MGAESGVGCDSLAQTEKGKCDTRGENALPTYRFGKIRFPLSEDSSLRTCLS